MKLVKPNFWIKKTLISFCLYPFSIITYFINIFKSTFTKKDFNIKTICIGNINTGGTGKTTTVVNLAHALALKNYKVLLIDMDPQGALSYYFGIDFFVSCQS